MKTKLICLSKRKPQSQETSDKVGKTVARCDSGLLSLTYRELEPVHREQPADPTGKGGRGGGSQKTKAKGYSTVSAHSQNMLRCRGPGDKWWPGTGFALRLSLQVDDRSPWSLTQTNRRPLQSVAKAGGSWCGAESRSAQRHSGARRCSWRGTFSSKGRGSLPAGGPATPTDQTRAVPRQATSFLVAMWPNVL